MLGPDSGLPQDHHRGGEKASTTSYHLLTDGTLVVVKGGKEKIEV